MVNSVTQNPQSLQARIIQGSVVLLSGSGLTMAINLAYNIAIARFLGPKGFGHATVVYTILTLLSAVTLAFQIVSTKVVAQQPTPQGRSAVYRFFHRGSWICGIIVALGLIAFEGPVADYLNLPDVSLVALIAIGAAFYVPLGARRGYIQGACGFRGLAVNMVLEQAVRLGGSLFFIYIGSGVHGVIIANSAAIAVAYYAVRVKTTGRMANPLESGYIIRETGQAPTAYRRGARGHGAARSSPSRRR